jgi:hypothetical protein
MKSLIFHLSNTDYADHGITFPDFLSFHRNILYFKRGIRQSEEVPIFAGKLSAFLLLAGRALF